MSFDSARGFSTSALLTFRAREFLAEGAVQYVVGCLATSLDSAR